MSGVTKHNDFVRKPQALADTAVLHLAPRKGANSTITPAGDRTITFTGAVAGDSGVLTWTGDGNGRSLTLGANQHAAGGDVADLVGLALNQVAKISWETHDGTNFYFWVTLVS